MESRDETGSTNQMEDFPEYSTELSRLSSFYHWPVSMKQTPKQLTDAGFFYTGRGDRVICFSCGGGLNSWEPDDDPWEQHALHYRKCHYVYLMKGENYHDKVKTKISSLTSTKATEIVNATAKTNTALTNTSSLHELMKCKICYQNDYNTVFLPCGHTLSCIQCALTVKKCPLCRKPIYKKIKIYLP